MVNSNVGQTESPSTTSKVKRDDSPLAQALADDSDLDAYFEVSPALLKPRHGIGADVKLSGIS